jgi:hypothetical protein
VGFGLQEVALGRVSSINPHSNNFSTLFSHYTILLYITSMLAALLNGQLKKGIKKNTVAAISVQLSKLVSSVTSISHSRHLPRLLMYRY